MNSILLNKKIELIQWLANLEDASIISKLSELKQSTVKEWSEELSENEITSIERGLIDASLGKTIPHAEVKKMYDKWL